MSGPLIAIVGPTASGKSALAMRIAQEYDGEIIAADSRTIYRGMDVGTAKPTAQDQRLVPHHLLDVVNPDQAFSAAQFKQLANRAIEDIQSRGKLPILVGGTGLYIDAVLFDFEFNAPADPLLRERLHAMSVEQLQNECRQNNISLPINSKNKRHLIRAIETKGVARGKKSLRDDTLVVGITTTKEKLRARIADRVHAMISAGVLDEVAALGRAYGWSGEAFKGNAYQIFRSVSRGEKTLDQAIQELVQSDMRLAKRQMTWFKRNIQIKWSEDPQVLMQEVDTFLRQYTQDSDVAV